MSDDPDESEAGDDPGESETGSDPDGYETGGDPGGTEVDVLERASTLRERGIPAAMLTVVGKEGSAPRDVGARMLVTADAEYGTIGGGTVERLAIEAGREVLAGDADPGVRTYDLRPGGNTGMVCGGSMDVFVERIRGQQRLVIAGGGHVSAALAPLARHLGYRVTVVDDREEYADPERFPDGVQTVHGDYGEAIRDLPVTEETAVAVATRSGTFDRRAVGAALEGGAGYVGLVASERKAERVLDDLADEGVDRAALARVRAPVGLDLGGSGPEDVALSTLAELHRDRHDASGARMTRVNLEDLAVVRGGGDLGSGVVYRLHRAGVPVVVTEVEHPTVVRRDVAFATAVYEGEVTVEGVTGRRVAGVEEALEVLTDGDVAVLVDPDAEVADRLDATVLVDAIMAKGRFDTGTRRDDAEVVVGMGPGFTAGDDVDAVIETDRGHRLGRVYYEGSASDYDGTPTERRGYTTERVFYAPTDGVWEPAVEIGDRVETGQVLGRVGDHAVESEIAGVVRGLVHGGIAVEAGTKLGDTDPREDVDQTKISDKALSLGGGVLEAVLALR